MLHLFIDNRKNLINQNSANDSPLINAVRFECMQRDQRIMNNYTSIEEREREEKESEVAKSNKSGIICP